MDLNCDLEKNECVTFLIWRMIVIPCAQYKRKSVQNTQILSSRFNWDYIFYWEYIMQPERFIPMVQTIFQQFVLTGAWNWPWCHQSNFFLPITWLLSRNAHFSQSSEFPMDKISGLDPFLFLLNEKEYWYMPTYMCKICWKMSVYVNFKGKYHLEYVSLPVTNNLQAVSKLCFLELFSWPFCFQTDVYTSIIHNGSLFGKLANYSFLFQSSLTGCSAVFSHSLSNQPWHTDIQSTKRVEKDSFGGSHQITQCSQTASQQRWLKPYSYL